MELENAESDLQSLRRLYGLLQSNVVDEPISETYLLDLSAQMLLKRLLDAATEELFTAQSKILAGAQLSLSDTVSSRAEQVKSLQKLKPSYTRNISSLSRNSSRNSKKDSNYGLVRTAGDEESLEKQMPSMASAEQSQMSLYSNTSGIKKKSCRVCQEKSTKQQNSGISPGEGSNSVVCQLGESNPFGSRHGCITRPLEAKERCKGPLEGDATTNQIGIRQLQRNENSASSVGCSWRSLASRGVKTPFSESNSLADQAVKNSYAISSGLTKEVADAIERIETQISALQLCSHRVESNNDNALNQWLSRSPSSVTPMERKEPELGRENKAALTGGYALDQGNQCSLQGFQENSSGIPLLFHEGHRDLPTHITSQNGGVGHRKSVQTSKSSLKSSNMKLSQQRGQTASNFNFSPIRRTNYNVNAAENRADSFTAAAESQCSQNIYGLRVPTIDNLTMPLQSHNNLSLCNRFVSVESPRKMGISRPPMPPRPARSIGFRKPSQNNRPSIKMHTRPTLLDQESQSWDEDPRDRKRGRTRSTRSSEDEFVSDQRESEETTSGYTSPSTGYTWTSQPDSISETSSGSYSSLPSPTSASSSGHHQATVAYPVSSEESNSSYSRQSDSDDRASPHKKAYRSSDHANPRKNVIGRFRRFKNKLGLIFHHHHHHHHHHHDNNTDHESEDGHKPSAWKKLYRTFHQKGERSSCRKDAEVGRLRKVKAGGLTTNKHQVGHFNALLEGLMRHARHSKKPKPTRKPQSRGVKSHWWQAFKRQGGAKLPRRGRVKLGYGSKREARPSKKR